MRGKRKNQYTRAMIPVRVWWYIHEEDDNKEKGRTAQGFIKPVSSAAGSFYLSPINWRERELFPLLLLLPSSSSFCSYLPAVGEMIFLITHITLRDP